MKIDQLRDIIKSELFLKYHSMLIEASEIGFISSKDLDNIMERHIIESVTPVLFWDKEFPNVKTVCDIGSGAGLPGIPLAISLPGIKFTLVEVMKKRADFLKKCCLELNLKNVEVINLSVEEVSLKSDLVVFRAFRKPIAAFELALFVLKYKGRILYFRNKPMFSDSKITIGDFRINELGFTYRTLIQNHPISNRNVGFVVGEQNSPPSKKFPRKYYKIKKDPLLKEV